MRFHQHSPYADWGFVDATIQAREELGDQTDDTRFTEYFAQAVMEMASEQGITFPVTPRTQTRAHVPIRLPAATPEYVCMGTPIPWRHLTRRALSAPHGRAGPEPVRARQVWRLQLLRSSLAHSGRGKVGRALPRTQHV